MLSIVSSHSPPWCLLGLNSGNAELKRELPDCTVHFVWASVKANLNSGPPENVGLGLLASEPWCTLYLMWLQTDYPGTHSQEVKQRNVKLCQS